MGKTIGVSLRLLLGLSLLGAAAAQQQSAVTNPPKVLVISREFLKPGHAGAMHEKTESAFVQAMTRANWPSHYLAMDALSGKLRSIFVTSYDSLASWEKDNRAIAQNATLSSAFDKAAPPTAISSTPMIRVCSFMTRTSACGRRSTSRTCGTWRSKCFTSSPAICASSSNP